MGNIHREINARIRAGKSVFLPIEPSLLDRRYDSTYIPRLVGSFELKKELARKITATEAKKAYGRGEVVIGRICCSGCMPSGVEYCNWGYKAFVKDGHSPEREKWYSTATWDRYGPGMASQLFGSSGDSSIDWFLA